MSLIVSKIRSFVVAAMALGLLLAVPSFAVDPPAKPTIGSRLKSKYKDIKAKLTGKPRIGAPTNVQVNSPKAMEGLRAGVTAEHGKALNKMLRLETKMRNERKTGGISDTTRAKHDKAVKRFTAAQKALGQLDPNSAKSKPRPKSIIKRK